MTEQDSDARRAAMARQFIEAIPHCRALNMELLDIGSGVAVMRIPYDERLIGDPDSGVLHGGVVTTLLDSCSGAAVFSHPSGIVSTATLDLRIDYMRGAKPGLPITVRAVCYRTTNNVAFVRAVAFDEDEDDPVAVSNGAFQIDRAKKKAA